MERLFHRLCLGLVSWGALGMGIVAQAQTTPVLQVPALEKVVWIWIENTPASTFGSQRYIRNLWQRVPSVRFTQYLPVSKVTQANAVAMITGTDHGVQDDQLVRIMGDNLVGLLQSKNIPWKVYAEDFPGACYQGAGVGNYRRYRVPFISLDQVQSNRFLCSNLVSFRNLTEDMRLSQLPRFSVMIPNLIRSGATGSFNDVEEFLRSVVDPIVETPEQLAETTIIISTVSNQDAKRPEMFLMILGGKVAFPGQALTSPFNHYHLLRTIEDGLRLGHLNRNDAQATPMVGFWVE